MAVGVVGSRAIAMLFSALEGQRVRRYAAVVGGVLKARGSSVSERNLFDREGSTSIDR
ncbi:hypothetical protein [Aureliella helgolandensis]|uniref:hypothetical protein n=1 Tax=Aureliella helgolandensis TaxID=2527968 RepID=UPI001E609786|nr:hypothetical protein [Aureliella helgolandensis]